MREFPFRLLNVFTLLGRRFSGNPLCVFEDGSHFSDEQMQAIARQFNLSETTFIMPPATRGAAPRVRIFTPHLEMPFAGHPTLGTAHVVQSLWGGERLTLAMKAGDVEVSSRGTLWTLRTPRAASTSAPDASRDELARALGLTADGMGQRPLWVDSGTEQLILPLNRAEDVARVRPDAASFGKHCRKGSGAEASAYVWAWTSASDIVARFFYAAADSVSEDPATGSACANLGGWLLTTGQSAPFQVRVRQGDATGRPALLHLSADADGHVFVGGEVLDVGRGMFSLEP